MRRFVVAVVLAACADESITDDEVGSSQAAAMSANAMSANAMSANAMSANAMSANAMSANAMSANALGADALSKAFLNSLHDPAAQEFMRYFVSCAFRPGESITFNDLLHYPPHYSLTYTGDLGMAPHARNEPLYKYPQEQELVTACLAARVNAYNVKVLLSLAGNNPTWNPSLFATAPKVSPNDAIPMSTVHNPVTDPCPDPNVTVNIYRSGYAYPNTVPEGWTRDCSWTPTYVTTCAPGSLVTVGVGGNAPANAQPSMMYYTDLYGGDYSGYITYSGAQGCQNDCANDQSCVAWTYVAPGYWDGYGRCLKKTWGYTYSTTTPCAAWGYCTSGFADHARRTVGTGGVDTMLRACAGDHVCRTIDSNYIASNDDTPGTTLSALTFQCPAVGMYTTMIAGYSQSAPLTSVSAASWDGFFPSREARLYTDRAVFPWKEAAYFGNMFNPFPFTSCDSDSQCVSAAGGNRAYRCDQTYRVCTSIDPRIKNVEVRYDGTRPYVYNPNQPVAGGYVPLNSNLFMCTSSLWTYGDAYRKQRTCSGGYCFGNYVGRCAGTYPDSEGFPTAYGTPYISSADYHYMWLYAGSRWWNNAITVWLSDPWGGQTGDNQPTQCRVIRYGNQTRPDPACSTKFSTTN